MPQLALRKIVTLQTELMKDASTKEQLNNGPGIGPPSLVGSQATSVRQPTTQRTLLSANFGNPLQNGARAANLLGRSVISAGDRIRDLIIPDALATVVSPPNWIPGIGGGARRTGNEKMGRQRAEKLRAELEEMLASSCPLCESVISGLDKPFVKEGEADTSWTL